MTNWQKLGIGFAWTPLILPLAYWLERENGNVVGMPLGALLRLTLIAMGASGFWLIGTIGPSRVRDAMFGAGEDRSSFRKRQYVATAVLFLVVIGGTVPGLVDQYAGDSGVLLPYQAVPSLIGLGFAGRWIWRH